MSAGGLSYDCLVTSRKVTLPSVEMWGTDMNILRDPPASLYTRRIDKVGDTQQVLLAQEDSGDRIAEMINVYARGVNPMVSVSYDNYGNNAGARSSVTQGSRAVKLPYKPEVFHPPVFRQEDLMPLSRQPRTWFYALSNPEVPNIVQHMSCPESKSAVWADEKLTRVEAPARIQYNNEAPLTNVNLSSQDGRIRHNVLEPDRLFMSYPQHEKNGNIEMTGKKNVHESPLHMTTEAPRSMTTVGSEKEMIVSAHPRSVHENKMLYKVFSNKSGNKNLIQTRDLVEKIQSRALHQNPLPVRSVVQNPVSLDSGMDTSYHVSDDSSFGNTLKKQLMQFETDSSLSGSYVKDGQTFVEPFRKEADHGFLYKEVVTKPSQSFFWKTLEPVCVDPRQVKKEILHTEHVAHALGPEKTGPLHSSLAKEPSRSLPQVMSETNKKGMYTKTSTQHTSLGGGKVGSIVYTGPVDSQKSESIRGTPIQDFMNVSLPIHEDPLHTPVTSSSGRDQATLQDTLYSDTVAPSLRYTAPPTQAFTGKTFFERDERIGTKHLNDRLLGNIETNTARDTTAHGHDMYNTVQSTDGSSCVSTSLPVGSFDPTPQGIPMTHRQYDYASEMPVRELSVKNRASQEYFTRFSHSYR